MSFDNKYKVLPNRVELYKYIATLIPTFDLEKSLKAPYFHFYMDDQWYRFRAYFPSFLKVINEKLNGKYNEKLSIFKGVFVLVENENTIIPVTGVTLDTTSWTTTVGQTKTLIATVVPSNATEKSVAFSTTNPDVVSVDGNGSLSTLATGTATINCLTLDGGFSATCNVVVEPEVTPVAATTTKRTTKKATTTE